MYVCLKFEILFQVSVPTLGNIHVEWPLYSKRGQPVQFHLPVVRAHHLNQEVCSLGSIVELANNLKTCLFEIGIL